MVETILQSEIFTKFAFPFLLIFFLVFGILEKTKLFGDGDKKQLNALISFVIGLIFVSAVFPKLVVENLILFLTVSMVVVFVGLLLWGFVSGGEVKLGDNMKKFVGALVFIALIVAVLWALGTPGSIFGDIFDFLFRQNWSVDFWTNFAFIAVIIAALVAMIKTGGSTSSS